MNRITESTCCSIEGYIFYYLRYIKVGGYPGFQRAEIKGELKKGHPNKVDWGGGGGENKHRNS